MKNIRKATKDDISRIAEILIFSKRTNYRRIFNDDAVSFGVMQVLPLAKEYMDDSHSLDTVWVYDDGFVKGMVNFTDTEVRELYVDPFFTSNHIGEKLLGFACAGGASSLWVLEKNERAISFYQRNGFILTDEKKYQDGTTEYIVKMKR